MTPKVSVIIPIYNAVRYIERCVHSLLQQSLEDMQFVFVNDASPDSSIDVVRAAILHYPERTSQVLVIDNKVHLGTSESRRIGVEAAQGDYIGFCDADDWVERTMFQSLYEQIMSASADIAVCDYYKEYSDGPQIWCQNYGTNPQESLRRAFDRYQFSFNMWNQLISKDLAVAGLQQVYPTSYSEDIFALMHIYYNAKKVVALKEPLYHYNLCNPLSMVSNPVFEDGFWHAQRINIDRICQLLAPKEDSEYTLVCNWLKFTRKLKCRRAFASLRCLYDEYSESHRDIMSYENLSVGVRRKYKIIFSSFWTLWFYERIYSVYFSRL